MNGIILYSLSQVRHSGVVDGMVAVIETAVSVCRLYSESVLCLSLVVKDNLMPVCG